MPAPSAAAARNPEPPPASAPAETRSRYTSLINAACKTVHEETEGDYTEQRCAGVAGIPVTAKFGDLRSDIDAGVAGDFMTLGAFNQPGDQLEWRLDAAGKPIAIIYRLTAEDGTKPLGSMLVVERIGTKAKPACWTGFVRGSEPDANTLARAKADKAATAPCLTAIPEI